MTDPGFAAVALGVGAIFGHTAEHEAHWSDPPNWTGRSAPVAEARRALGPDYATAAARGAAFTDDELVAYLDVFIADLETGTPAPPGQPR